jgi:hypothetical protein
MISIRLCCHTSPVTKLTVDEGAAFGILLSEISFLQNHESSPISVTITVSQMNRLSDGKNVLQFTVDKYSSSPANKSYLDQPKCQEELTKVWDQTYINVHNLKNSIDCVDKKESENLSKIA